MTRSELAIRADVPDDCIRTATSLFACMHAAPTLAHTERLAHWLGQHPLHVRALDIALTQWGLAQSGHSATAGGTSGTSGTSGTTPGATAGITPRVASANGG